MSAPPPPPPPPLPESNNVSRQNNKNLLVSICNGTTLKKVPESFKNDRSGAIVGKPKGGSKGINNNGSLVPPGGAMSISEAILARKNMAPGNANVKRPGLPPPNAIPSSVVPPPPSQNKKPTFIPDTKSVQSSNFPQPPSQCSKPVPEMKPLPLNFLPPPYQGINIPPPIPLNSTGPLPPPSFCAANNTVFPPPQNPGININMPPPPPPKEIKPRFRPPVPICSKPTVSDEKLNNRGMTANQSRGPIPPPPPPITSLPNGGVLKLGIPPPPPPMQGYGRIPTPVQVITPEKPKIPIRIESNCDFDSRFNFVDPKYFPEPNSIIKMRHS